MLNFTVNAERCVRCGQCSRDCPARIIVQKGAALPRIRKIQEAMCLQCQHCLAICPKAAISILGRKPEDSLPLSAASFPDFETMNRLVRSRRSIRQYKDENVDPALLRRILAALANAPSGVNRRELTFSLIDDKAVMQRFRDHVMKALAAALAGNGIPEQRTLLHNAVPAYFDQGIDIIFRGAPHALIVSAPADAPCPREDIALALAYFELLAQSAGLGTVWWGMFSMVLGMLPELKPLVGLPPNQLFYAMLFGVPAVRFARTVQRDDAAVVRRIVI